MCSVHIRHSAREDIRGELSELDLAFHRVEMGTVLFLRLCCILPGILGSSVSTSHSTVVVLGAEMYATVPHYVGSDNPTKLSGLGS